MEGVDYQIFGDALGGTVADAAFPDGDGLGDADEEDGEPAREEEGEEGRGLDVGEEGVGGVVDGVELVVDAAVDVLYV